MTKRPYQPIAKRRTLGEDIGEILRERVLGGDLAPGEQLPSEHQLALSFQVSRTVIREAISRLRVDGLVHTRHGIGAFVSSPEAPGTFGANTLDPTALVSFAFELRRTTEPEATALAARRRSAAQLETIERRLDALDAALLANEGGAEGDASFHDSIAAASNNPLFVSLGEFVHGILRQSLATAHRALGSGERDRETLLREHAAIADAIRAGDEAQARAAALAHLARASERLRIP